MVLPVDSGNDAYGLWTKVVACRRATLRDYMHMCTEDPGGGGERTGCRTLGKQKLLWRLRG